MTLERTHTRADVHAILLYLSLARARFQDVARERGRRNIWNSRINVRDQSGIVPSVYFASVVRYFSKVERLLPPVLRTYLGDRST